MMEVTDRLTRLRKELRKAKLSGFLATRPEDVRYLSGFTGRDSCLLITGSRQWLLTDSRYTEEARKSAPEFETLMWKKGICRFAGELAKKSRLKCIGFNANHLTVTGLKMLRTGGRGVCFREAGGICNRLRSVKSKWEITRIQKALKCAEGAFEQTRKHIKAGMTETDIRLDLEWEMRRRGADDAAFETIVACGANASLPHAHAGKRKVKPGIPILIDFGARINGYNSDLTRVLFLDNIRPRWQRCYNMVLEAQKLGFKALAPGVAASKADEAARGSFTEKGCAEYFTHSLGHGVGLAVHEAPGLSRRSSAALTPGMVVTVEPGLYYPGQGGIRIEDMAIITAKGARLLSNLPKDLDWATI